MSIELADTNGSLGQAATNTGFNDAREAVEASNYKDAKQFFDEGYTKKPKDVADQIIKLAVKTKCKSTRSTLINISHLLNEAEDFAVVQL